MTGERVFFIDDEEHLRIVAAQTFELADMDATCFSSPTDVIKQIDQGFDGVLVTDIRMPGMDGLEFLQRVLQIDKDLPVILVTGHGDVALAVECIKTGAYDFIEKPWNPERLANSVRRAAAQRQLTLENRALREQVAVRSVSRQSLFGRSPAMERLRRSIEAVAATDVDVLVTGETGTGKEVVARLLHSLSARADGPFVQINCAALPDALIESELFGHEAGAFPGAVRARYGKLEHARRGVLCLDEIDLLPMPLQAKLLDVLHNRQVTRLGSNDPVALDIRVIAISKTNLEQAVEQGRFRADLLYRLNVASLQLPVLNDRREDVPGLFMLLAADIAQQNGLKMPEIPITFLNTLASRDWPGNVRELRNEAERMILGISEMLHSGPNTARTLAERVGAFEKSLIEASISANGGCLKDTYESLGISRKSLYDKMQRYGLSRSDFTGEQ